MTIVYRDVSRATEPSVTARRTIGRVAIVLHSTEGLSSRAWLQGGSARDGDPASADYLIDRDGSINQITQPGWFAYHVGVATWRGLPNRNGLLNMMLIGIEMESYDKNMPRYTDEQIITCAALVRKLWAYHRLDVLGLLRHGDIAQPPGRRSDPVNFPGYTFTRELLAPSKLPDSLVWPQVFS